MTSGPTPELALGTVQFGLQYGIAGPGSATSDTDARRVLECAADYGIARLDTAPGYGDIEARLSGLITGLAFKIVSKIPAIPLDLQDLEAAGFVINSLELSRKRLGDALRGILFHHAEDVSSRNGDRLWEAAARWCEINNVTLGVSCYDPGSLEALAHNRNISMAQIPSSAFDQRLVVEGREFGNIELTVRSLFLQGLLLMPRDAAMRRLPASAAAITRWHQWCENADCSPLEAALSFAKGLAGARYCVVGVDSVTQLVDIAETWERIEPVVDPGMAISDPDVIDPRRWKLAA